ncbi:MAG: hypothetical protein ABIO81_02980, partial [Ginsengibacter sp.]
SITGQEEDFVTHMQTLESQGQTIHKGEAQFDYKNNLKIITEEELIVPDTQTFGTEQAFEKTGKYNNEKDTGNVIEEKEIIPGAHPLLSDIQNLQETAKEYNYENDRKETDQKEEEYGHDFQPIDPNAQIAEKNNTLENKLQDIDKLNTPQAAESMLFEPLHTVDYFASLGIRISDEPLTNDKLGNQMKSFTEWLKSMKKIHPDKLPEQNSLAEDIIQSAAEVSNIDTEVLTEAMAEVLIKQDKKDKAIEMYNKLSLINPSKRAYFAGKIESIKST